MVENQKGGGRWVGTGLVFMLALVSMTLAVGGETTDAFNPSPNGQVMAMLVDPDGRIVLGGSFTQLSGATCARLGRLNLDGSYDGTFGSGADATVQCLALQPDGKILVGGSFTTLANGARARLGRLNADGSLDPTFTPSVGGNSAWVSVVVIQPDGKLLVGGSFSSLCGQARTNLGRLNPDGSLDTTFVANAMGANAQVLCLACQPDQKILVGGTFSSLAGQARTNFGRLNVDGTIEAGFSPNPNGLVKTVVFQADGQILVGGAFTMLGGQARTRLARLTANGAVDGTFSGSAGDTVNSLQVRVDGKILVGGLFITLSGQSRSYLGRLNSNGALDSSFGPGTDAAVLGLGMQADGALLVEGLFTMLGGQPRSGVGRLASSPPATQSLNYDGWSLTWLRDGSGPEVWRTTFEASIHGGPWVSLGDGQRIAGGWWPVGWDLPTDLSQLNIRARGLLSGGLGNASSWFAEMIIGPVLLLRQPESQTNEPGTVARFSLSAGGSLPLTFQWRKGDTVLMDGGKISGARTATLTVSNALGAEAGAYSVVVSNGFGSVTSQVATLTIPGDPRITVQPVGRTNDAGTQASFSVTAQGTTPTYQWRKAGVDLVDGGNISGARTPVLTLSQAFGGDAGAYSVVVSSPFGSVTSQVASLCVVGDPRITVQPASRLESAGTTIAFSVTVVGTAPVYQWRKEGVELSDGGDVRGARSPTLVLSNLLGGSAGNFTVVVSNAFGSVTSQVATLIVTHDPFISTQPVGQSVSLGQTVQLSVVAGGTAPLAYQWLKQSRELVDGGNLSGTRSAVLTVSQVTRSDAGEYRVTVSNGFGKVFSGTAFLTVVVDPLIVTQPVGLTNPATSPASLSITATGTAPLSYQWFRDGTALADSEGITGAQSATLSFQAVYGAHAGRYWVVITNLVGSDTSAPVRLDVLDPYITNHPRDQIITAGRPVYCSVIGCGTEPLAYQWRKGGMPLPGATQSTLRMTNAQTADTGSYDVILTNGWGSVTSRMASVRIATVGVDWLSTSADSSVYAFLPLPDGELLVGGAFNTLGSYERHGLGRTTLTGSVDPFFAPGYGNATVYCLALQADGKVIVGGSFTNLTGQNCRNLARLNRDGTLDLVFRPAVSNTVYSLAVQPDGQILIGGEFLAVDSQARGRLARLDRDGRLDPSFNPNFSGTVYGLAIQPDGKILVGGAFGTISGLSRPGLGRLLADGTVETNFDAKATATVRCIAVQPNGQILVGGGFLSLGGKNRRGLGRLNPDGSLDSAFDAGVVGEVRSLLLQSDGRIFVAGSFSALGGQTHYSLGRLNADGSVDEGVTTSANGSVLSLAMQGDGRILLGGDFTVLDGFGHSRLGRLTNSLPFVQTLSADAHTVTWQRDERAPELAQVSFDYLAPGTDWISLGAGARIPGGWQASGPAIPTGATLRARGWLSGGCSLASRYFIDFSSGPPVITLQPASIRVLPGNGASFSVAAAGSAPLFYQWFYDGGLLSGATNATLTYSSLSVSVSGHSFSVVVSNAYGAVTSAEASVWVFGRDQANPRPNGPVYALAIQPDGKTLLGGGFSSLGTSSRRSLARLSVLGGIDGTFNPGANGPVYCFGVQTDGKILVGGAFTQLAGQSRASLGRLNPDGSLDPGFLPTFGRHNLPAEVYALAVQPDGRILVGGNFDTSNGASRNLLARINADGSLDGAFVPPPDTNSIMSGLSFGAHAITLQPEGDIFAFGVFPSPIHSPPEFVYYWQWLNADGTLRAHSDPVSASQFLYSHFCCALQPDGKVVFGSSRYPGLQRLNRDTSLDTNFPSRVLGALCALALQADGRILVGGTFQLDGGGSSALIRLNPDGEIDQSLARQYLITNGTVYALTLAPDGKIVAGGDFVYSLGTVQSNLIRFYNAGPATQNLVATPAALSWEREETSPELWRTWFEASADGVAWADLGAGVRVPGGWRLTGLSLPVGTLVRARGFVVDAASDWFAESTTIVTPAEPILVPPQILRGDSDFGVHSNRFGFNLVGAAGQIVVVEYSTNLTTWTPVVTNAFGPSPYRFNDSSTLRPGSRFYRARLK